jgi:tetratricopeptide (TPR) repeat protein
MIFNHFKYLIAEYWDEIRGNKSSPEGYLNRGKTYIFLGEYEQAVNDFEQATKVAPNLPEPWYHLGVAYMKLNKLMQAEAAFVRAETLAPKDFNTVYNLAFCRTELNHCKKAIEQWKKVLSYQKDIWEAYFYRGKMYLQDSKYANAIRDFLDAIAFLPSTQIAHITECEYYLAKCYLENLEYRNAIEYADKVIAAMPTHKDAYFVRGIAKKNLNDLKGWEEDLKLSEKNNPFKTTLAHNLSVLIVDKDKKKVPKKAEKNSGYLEKAQNALNNGNFEEAIEALSKVIQADKEHSQAYFLRGVAYMQLINTGKAENDFNMAISLNKQHWQYYSERAKLYDLIGKTESAKKDRKKAKELNN